MCMPGRRTELSVASEMSQMESAFTFPFDGGVPGASLLMKSLYEWTKQKVCEPFHFRGSGRSVTSQVGSNRVRGQSFVSSLMKQVRTRDEGMCFVFLVCSGFFTRTLVDGCHVECFFV